MTTILYDWPLSRKMLLAFAVIGALLLVAGMRGDVARQFAEDAMPRQGCRRSLAAYNEVDASCLPCLPDHDAGEGERKPCKELAEQCAGKRACKADDQHGQPCGMSARCTGRVIAACGLRAGRGRRH